MLFDLGIKGVGLGSGHLEILGCATELGEEKEADCGGNGRGIKAKESDKIS
ncbi:hypothetical protein RchiOBHm_Chr5g0029481 [Rosa chinensis]|uniref:Uncharacterized protein n=1 Tax=Rosa chinensis TaxID=74649 RepID=A0A2P6Q9M9_ROSCH|nr:hypothetical protein RchiOBHm_Chr5g0029481 [Rosa chinensis]